MSRIRFVFLQKDGHVGHGLAVLFLLCVLWGGGVQAAADLGVGQVRAVEGEAVTLRKEVRHNLVVGARVFAHDVIETGDESKIRIAFHDGTVLMAGANTRVSIEEYDPRGSGRGLLSLLSGIIRTQLSSFWDSEFAVETRATIASVRSTDWITIAEPERGSVFVVTGTVDVTATATGESTALPAGFGIDVEVGRGLPPAREWPAERVERTLGRLPPAP